MKPAIIALAGIALVSLWGGLQSIQSGQPLSNGPYLGQEPPGMEPELFAPGVVSTTADEINSVFTPCGSEFYFSAFIPGHGYTIMVMKQCNSGWGRMSVAPFSGKYSEVDMFISPDGTRAFFVSKRPYRHGQKRSRGYQIWAMDREGDAWSEPKHLGPNVNPGSRQLYPSVSRDGTLYFSSNLIGFGRMDFYKSEFVDGRYAEPENLGGAINTRFDESDGLIAPDESWLIFTSSGRPDSYGSGDLYISFRRRGGGWTKAVNMGEQINTKSSEFCPGLSPDEKYFFFTSGRGGSDDIYWVDAAIIEQLNPAIKK
jgi:Tol biopolymer transport system component